MHTDLNVTYYSLRYRQKVNHYSLWLDTIMTNHYRLFPDAAISVILIADNVWAKLLRAK